jgi:hypothetical protein
LTEVMAWKAKVQDCTTMSSSWTWNSFKKGTLEYIITCDWFVLELHPSQVFEFADGVLGWARCQEDNPWKCKVQFGDHLC